MNVLNARVGEVDFASEKNSDLHMNSLGVESVAKRVISEIKIGQAEDYAGTGENGAEDIIRPERWVRAFQSHDLGGHFWGAHLGIIALQWMTTITIWALCAEGSGSQARARHRLHTVKAGVQAAVEGGILPPGLVLENPSVVRIVSQRFRRAGCAGSTAVETPATTGRS